MTSNINSPASSGKCYPSCSQKNAADASRKPNKKGRNPYSTVSTLLCRKTPFSFRVVSWYA